MSLFKKIMFIFKRHYLKKKGYSDYYIMHYNDELEKGYRDKSFSLKDRKWVGYNTCPICECCTLVIE